MSSTATLVYTAYLAGASAAKAAALMGAANVPVPTSVLNAFGLRVISDSTPAASPCVRTIVLGLNPVAAATATATLAAAGDSASGIGAVTVTGAGSGYTACPIVTTSGGFATTPVRTLALPGPQQFRQFVPGNVPAQQSPLARAVNVPPSLQAYLKAVSTTIVAGGTGYSAGTTLQLSGFLPRPGGRLPVPYKRNDAGVPIVLTPTIAGGVITGVAITNAGSYYTGTPVVTAVDPLGTGSGANITLSMGVGAIDVFRAGSGYNAAPTVVLTPLYQALFPATGNQAKPLADLMVTALQQALMAPVSASTPVIV